jgi:hypothetical protein
MNCTNYNLAIVLFFMTLGFCFPMIVCWIKQPFHKYRDGDKKLEAKRFIAGNAARESYENALAAARLAKK